MKTFLHQEQNDWINKRFLYLAEGGGPEGMGPAEDTEGGGGVSEEAAERAAEERRQSRKAAKKQRKEEKKVKKRDNKLADIIRSFINGAHKDDQMALLLSRLFQRNTPAPILLAVLSLNYSDVVEVLDNYLEDEQDVLPDDKPIQDGADANSQALVEYGKELAQSLQEWTRRIFTHASFHPMKSILALAHHHGVDHNMIDLTSVMIHQYFKESQQEVEFARIKEFSELFWRDTLKRLHMMASERGLLPESIDDPLDDEEDWDDDDDEDDDE